MKNKKADVWISGVMYFALGVIVLTIVLTASMPVINKLRDKNTALQTKELMFKLDDNIRTVLAEGPGSKRNVRIQIGRGDFTINDGEDTIRWEMKSSVLLSQEDKTVTEGSVDILSSKTSNPKEWMTTLTLSYGNSKKIADIEFPPGKKLSKLSGTYNLVIQNIGDPNEDQIINVQISEI